MTLSSEFRHLEPLGSLYHCPLEPTLPIYIHRNLGGIKLSISLITKLTLCSDGLYLASVLCGVVVSPKPIVLIFTETSTRLT